MRDNGGWARVRGNLGLHFEHCAFENRVMLLSSLPQSRDLSTPTMSVSSGTVSHLSVKRLVEVCMRADEAGTQSPTPQSMIAQSVHIHLFWRNTTPPC